MVYRKRLNEHIMGHARSNLTMFTATACEKWHFQTLVMLASMSMAYGINSQLFKQYTYPSSNKNFNS